MEVLGVDASGLPDTPVVGAPMTVRAAVALAGLDPADVAVEVVVGRVDETDELSDAVTVPMKHVGPVGRRRARRHGAVRGGGAAAARGAHRLHGAGAAHNPLLASPVELGKVVLAG